MWIVLKLIKLNESVLNCVKSTESTSYDGDISQDNFELDPENIDQDVNRSILSDSATYVARHVANVALGKS